MGKKVLFSEDATKIFKMLSEGKRYKKGIALSRTCHIFSVAWELPEEKGRILPSKVARHFKQVLPSKKQKQKAKVKKAENGNIKPSIAKSSTMRSAMAQHTQRSTVTLNSKALHGALGLNGNGNGRVPLNASKRTAKDAHLPKKSIIGSLEDMLSADVHRSNAEDESEMDSVYAAKVKHEKARSLTDLEVNVADEADGDGEGNEEEEVSEVDEIFARHQKGLANVASPQATFGF